jgi:4-amino-4-deoxy-L-arabinose transferase-like glycosyltransferase
MSLLERVSGWRSAMDGVSLWKASLCLFAIAFLLRAGLVLTLKSYCVVEHSEPVRVAESLARTNAFSNPFAGKTGPTAHLSPGHPFLLSLIYRSFGFGSRAELVKELLSSAISSLQYAMLPLVAVAFGAPASAGLLAGAFGAVLPLFFWIETKGTWEQPEAMVLLFAALSLSSVLARRLNIRWSLASGVAWGVAFLFMPSFVTVFAGLLALWLWSTRGRCWKLAVIASLFAMLVVAPWIWRNYRTFGSVFWLRDNFGLEFHVSNMDGSSPRIEENLSGAPFRSHPSANPEESTKLAFLGESAYFRLRFEAGRDWVRAHPAQFLHLTAERIWFFWFPRLNHWLKTWLAGALSILGILGLFRMIRAGLLGAKLLGVVWILYPLPYYFVQVDPRYRYPVHATALLLAGLLTLHLGKLRPLLSASDSQGPGRGE